MKPHLGKDPIRKENLQHLRCCKGHQDKQKGSASGLATGRSPRRALLHSPPSGDPCDRGSRRTGEGRSLPCHLAPVPYPLLGGHPHEMRDKLGRNNEGVQQHSPGGKCLESNVANHRQTTWRVTVVTFTHPSPGLEAALLAAKETAEQVMTTGGLGRGGWSAWQVMGRGLWLCERGTFQAP